MKSKNTQKLHAKMVENIYDVILQTEFEQEAKKKLKKWIGKKNVSVDYEHGILEIGSNFKMVVLN